MNEITVEHPPSPQRLKDIGALYWSQDAFRWQWNLPRISADSAEKLLIMQRRISFLKPLDRQVLATAATLGSHFGSATPGSFQLRWDTSPAGKIRSILPSRIHCTVSLSGARLIFFEFLPRNGSTKMQ